MNILIRAGWGRDLARIAASVLLVGCGGVSEPPAAETDGADAGTSTGSATTSDSESASSGATGAGSASGGSSSGSGGTDSGASATAGSASAGTSGPLFDVGSPGTGGPVECGCGSHDFSYLWAANAPDSTVSKINTRTMQEEGRYPTHPQTDANPSRTSVSVDGRAVVVQNRNKPGMAKIWARPELCDPDRNGVAGLQTSDGSANVLDFSEDDCIAWWLDFPDMTVQRPVAWTQGTLNLDTCEYENQKIWTVTGDQGTDGHCGADGVWVHLVDGDTGVIDDSLHIDEVDFPCNNTRGAYGGAVDNQGNFWFSGWQNGRLARVNFATQAITVVDVPGSNPYGITVDTQGRPWLTWPVRRYDPVLDQWDEIALNASTGIAEDREGRMWVSDGADLLWIDRDTMALGPTIDLPAGDGTIPRGIAVDVDGMVWVVRRLSNLAYRIDPATSQVDEFNTLNGAYTYSDMAGGQIQAVTCNPPS